MMGRGSNEAQSYHSLAFVRKGAYRFHRHDHDVIIDPMTAMFFARNFEYAVSHPFDCGDDCVEFRFDQELLSESRPVLRNLEKTEDTTVPAIALSIDSNIRSRVSILVRQVELGMVSDLAIDETAVAILDLVAGIETAGDGIELDDRTLQNAVKARKRVDLAREILLSDLGRNWALAEIAHEVSASPFHLTRLVRQFTGQTLHQYLMQQRLAVALQRILEGAKDITALAFDLGFASHSHFSASFKREYGDTPSNFRNAFKN